MRTLWNGTQMLRYAHYYWDSSSKLVCLMVMIKQIILGKVL